MSTSEASLVTDQGRRLWSRKGVSEDAPPVTRFMRLNNVNFVNLTIFINFIPQLIVERDKRQSDRQKAIDSNGLGNKIANLFG